ncbi:MAG: molybdate ABC transporter substrate-binding protein [Sulfurovum sp.]|nr:molybdate ABC transporter substrate-binding protein [Sulfurovum sp.]
MTKIILVLGVLYSTILFASQITIAVSANVSYAIEPLKKAFTQLHPQTEVRIILGSSGKLMAQISHGAPYQLFMSANMAYPQALYTKGLTQDRPLIYAQGALAILSQKPRNYCADIFTLNDPDIRHIAIANPKTAPYGKASVEALKKARLYRKLEKKFVYGESISQTLIYATKVADIGIIAKSALYSPRLLAYKEAIHWSEIDSSLYTPIQQGMVILKEGKGLVEVQAFYDFILSPQAQKILRNFGYTIP